MCVSFLYSALQKKIISSIFPTFTISIPTLSNILLSCLVTLKLYYFKYSFAQYLHIFRIMLIFSVSQERCNCHLVYPGPRDLFQEVSSVSVTDRTPSFFPSIGCLLTQDPSFRDVWKDSPSTSSTKLNNMPQNNFNHSSSQNHS